MEPKEEFASQRVALLARSIDSSKKYSASLFERHLKIDPLLFESEGANQSLVPVSEA